MSIARGFPNAGHYYSNIVKPIEIDLNFVVDSTNGNGLGIRSLKSNGYVRNVFMHTTASPGTNDGALNPNPLAGYAWIQLNQNFNKYIGGFQGFVSQLSGVNVAVGAAALTLHQPYVITAVGTTTLAQWQAVGLPQGLTPTVGQSFFATATGAGAGSGFVQAPGVSGIAAVEVIGDPNLESNNSSIASNGGAYLMVQFLNASLAPVAPANNAVCGMSMIWDGSSVTVDGL